MLNGVPYNQLNGQASPNPSGRDLSKLKRLGRTWDDRGCRWGGPNLTSYLISLTNLTSYLIFVVLLNYKRSMSILLLT